MLCQLHSQILFSIRVYGVKYVQRQKNACSLLRLVLLPYYTVFKKDEKSSGNSRESLHVGNAVGFHRCR